MSKHPEQADPAPGRYIVVPPLWNLLPLAGKAGAGAKASNPPVEIPHAHPDVIDLQASISRLCPPPSRLESSERAQRPVFTNRQANPIRNRFHLLEPGAESGDQRLRPPPDECPVIPAAQKALDSAQALTRALRKLHTSTSKCFACAYAGPGEGEQEAPSDVSASRRCPILRQFDQQLEIALQEVADEWHLT